jgi:hypothetical protein
VPDYIALVMVKGRPVSGTAPETSYGRASDRDHWPVVSSMDPAESVALLLICEGCGGTGKMRNGDPCQGHLPSQDLPSPELFSPVCCCRMAWGEFKGPHSVADGVLLCGTCLRLEEILLESQ